MNEQFDLLDAKECAELLHCSTRTLWRYMDSHKGPVGFKSPGGRWLYWKRDVLKYIGELRSEAMEAREHANNH